MYYIAIYVSIMHAMYIYIIHTGKCHKETPCVAILNKQKCLNKLKNSRAEQVLPGGGGWYQWEDEGSGERAWKGEYSEDIVYTCM
jgi:hypothetical protein